MVLPVALVRMSRSHARESLDGFMIGSLAALCFTAAATVTRLAPQLASGPVARERPMVGGLALIALPTVLQAALLHEEHDDTSPDEPVLCIECEYVVPDMAFCAHCGMAANASSRG